MPQVQLPIFPAGSVEINRELACRVEGEQVVYFNGQLPVFAHAKNDLASFRLFTSQLIVQRSAQTRVLSDTLRKAIKAGRLPAVKKKEAHRLGPQKSKAAP